MRLEGKKLLILGANPETCELVRTAQEMGVYTIVSDYNPKAIAKTIADKSYDVDGIDVNGLINIAKMENVDGVLVGVADLLIDSYQQVCSRLGMPAFAETREQVNSLVNKFNFKRMCESYGIPGVPEYRLSNEANYEEIRQLTFPALIKPADSCAGKGMTICYCENDVEKAISKALSASGSKHFLAERYMTCDDSFVYFTIKDGKCYLSAMADRYTNHEQIGHDNVVVGGIYPSKHIDMYLEKYHKKFCQMFSDLKIRNGVILVQAFIENEKMYVYDPGFRLQGASTHILINKINGFDQRKMLICLALTGSMGEDNLDLMNDYRFGGKYAGSIVFLLKKGVVGKIIGIEKVKKIEGVIGVIQRLFEGDEVYNIGTEQQVLVRILYYGESKDKLRKLIREIKDAVKVYDTYGNNMMLATLDENVI